MCHCLPDDTSRPNRFIGFPDDTASPVTRFPGSPEKPERPRGAGPSAAVALKGPAPLFRRVPRETGRPPPLWCLRLTCETLCGGKRDGTLLRGCHQLVRCLCVIRMPVIVAIFFKFRSFPILFEWIPIFHCLLC